jgi:hypothetical protein
MIRKALTRIQIRLMNVVARLRDDRGSYSTETAVVTTLLVGGAIIILGIIVGFGTDLANNIEFGPPAP